jgi:hypothetical protein
MKQFLLLYVFVIGATICYGQRIDGYVCNMKLRSIKSENAQLEMHYSKTSHLYDRLIFQYDDNICRIEMDTLDHVPLNARSIIFVVEFLSYNGWEKVSLNEDVSNSNVTIFCKRKIKIKGK